MNGHFPARKGDRSDTVNLTRFPDNASQKFYWKESGWRMVQRIFITRTVAAMQIASISQLDDDSRRVVLVQVNGTRDDHQSILSRRMQAASRRAPVRSVYRARLATHNSCSV